MTDADTPDDQPEIAAEIPAEIPGETPVQRALRLKTARLDARAKPPRGGKFQREQAAKIATGKSRPWMSR